MVAAKRSESWDHTSAIWCLTANINRDRNKQPEPFDFNDIHPYYRERVSEQDQEKLDHMVRRMNRIDELAKTDKEAALKLIEYTWPSGARSKQGEQQ